MADKITHFLLLMVLLWLVALIDYTELTKEDPLKLIVSITSFGYLVLNIAGYVFKDKEKTNG